MIKKTAENYQNCYIAEKRIVINPKFISIAQIEHLNDDRVKIWRLYLLDFPRNKLSKSVTVGSDRFIVLNDSTSPKMIIKIYFNFFQIFVKVLELFGCCWGKPYTTADGNFVSFAQQRSQPTESINNLSQITRKLLAKTRLVFWLGWSHK